MAYIYIYIYIYQHVLGYIQECFIFFITVYSWNIHPLYIFWFFPVVIFTWLFPKAKHICNSKKKKKDSALCKHLPWVTFNYAIYNLSLRNTTSWNCGCLVLGTLWSKFNKKGYCINNESDIGIPLVVTWYPLVASLADVIKKYLRLKQIWKPN